MIHGRLPQSAFLFFMENFSILTKLIHSFFEKTSVTPEIKGKCMKELNKTNSMKRIIKKCHMCGQMHDTATEIQKCKSCKKSFLPSNYFSKIHANNSQEFKMLFSEVNELHEEDIIKGITVIW